MTLHDPKFGIYRGADVVLWGRRFNPSGGPRRGVCVELNPLCLSGRFRVCLRFGWECGRCEAFVGTGEVTLLGSIPSRFGRRFGVIVVKLAPFSILPLEWLPLGPILELLLKLWPPSAISVSLLFPVESSFRGFFLFSEWCSLASPLVTIGTTVVWLLALVTFVFSSTFKKSANISMNWSRIIV